MLFRSELDADVDVGIRLLFMGQSNIAADTSSTTLMGSSIGRLHDTWPAASHDRESQLRHLGADVPGEFVVRIVLHDPGRPEDRHTGSDEVEPTETPHQFAHDPRDGAEFVKSPAGSGEEDEIPVMARHPEKSPTDRTTDDGDRLRRWENS